EPGLPRSRHDARRRRPPRAPRHHLRNERRKLSAPRRDRPKAARRRSARKGRDNQKYRRVAPRQSSPDIGLASDKQTHQNGTVAVRPSHPDRRNFSSSLGSSANL